MKLKKPRTLIKCMCGCGQELISVDDKGRDRKFLQGHNAQGKHWQWNNESKEKVKGISTRDIKGEANPLWNGGRYVDVYGYVWILKPEHPNATKNGYIREHRLVLEQKIGRLLLPGEIPHHVNGIKSDNRPENLELYGSQSKHIREAHYAKNND